MIKANTAIWKTDTLIAHLKTDLRTDRLCQNNVNEWLITVNCVSPVRECATWWSESWRAIFIKLLTMWRKSAGLCFFVTDAEESTPFFQFPGKSWGDINSPDVLVSGTIKTTFPECSCEVMWSVWRLMNEPRYQLCDNYLHNTSTTPTQRCRYGRLVCFNASKWHCKVTVKRLRTVHILFCMTDALKRAHMNRSDIHGRRVK